MDSAGEEILKSGNEEEDPAPIFLIREPSDSDLEAPEPTHLYFRHLGSLRCNAFDWIEENISTYCYDDKGLSTQGLTRITKELKSLSRSLPCEP
ncbi:unnamed protein product [Blepharisma stoltei]|uniref:Uncharacterized protein n=1 Tax=Blepharisma stoltei TaxID=1481888 RepID=A0AAU9IJC7_9CILI|nr:unnamed protein product [Blepharisma stoltei]